MSIKYYYFSNRATKNQTDGVTQIGAKPPVRSKSQLDLLPRERYNPLFNISNDFIGSLQSLDNIDLGKAMPHISIASVDLLGREIKNYTLDLFQKQANFDDISKGIRYSERPAMSLMGLDLETDSGGNSGTIYLTRLTMNLRLNSPDTIVQDAVVAFLFPGMTFKLTYGWNSDNPILGKTKTVFFAIENYNVSITSDGQVDLTVYGTTFNDKFSNIFLGDVGKVILDPKESAQVDGIDRSYALLQNTIKYLTKIEEGVAKEQMDQISQRLESYNTTAQRARKEIKNNLATLLNNLGKDKSKFFVLNRKYGKKVVKKNFITLHDLISALCTDTFNALEGKIFPKLGTYRFSYGAFSKQCGEFADSSIAEFPIDWEEFNKIYKSAVEEYGVLPIKVLFDNILIHEFLSNEFYWNSLQSQKAREEFQSPYIVFNFHNYNYSTKDDSFCTEFYLIDGKRDVPPVAADLFKDKGRTIRSSKDLINKVKTSYPEFPIIQVGHMSSFVKNINIQQVSNEQLKAMFINEMSETQKISLRYPIPIGETLALTPAQPIVLPLEGSMELLGHVDWEPQKSFLLSTGVFFIDGIYSILSVKHSLKADGFTTTINFQYTS